jgi:hypothetical protein
MNMRRLIIPIVLAVPLLVSQCYYDNKEELYQNLQDAEEEVCPTDSLSYSQDIAPILEANCATSGCHLGPNGTRGLDLSQYADVKFIAEKEIDDRGGLLNRINGIGPIMPQSGSLPACEIEKITAWIDQGVLNN